ncbi:MAG: Gfo/Idh/MocA family oxidoreductase [Nitrospinae bacterium]|nr:Gfo/Idh/MocA family oxidoreductase [Nitrospinota bacterium]
MGGKNIALVGCGYWGKNLARNLGELGALNTICDTAGDSLAQFKGKYDALLCDDYQQTLANPAIKGVMLATPAETHYSLGKMALAAGKDLYVEKPLSLKVAHAEELVALAEKHKRILMVGHILHYHPAVVKMKEIIASGGLGRIQTIYSNRMSLGKIRREENILWSFAPHDVSLIQSLVKETPSRIYSSGGYFLHEKIADTTLSVFEYESGVRAHIYVSWLHPFKEQRLVVVGSKKMLVFNDVEEKDKLLVYPHEIEWKDTIPVPSKKDAVSAPFGSEEPLKQECRAFMEAIATRKKPITDGREGLATLKILTACQQSLESQTLVKSGPAVEQSPAKEYYAHPTALVDEPCKIGKGSKIWHFSHVMAGAKLGDNCNIGQNVFIAGGVTIGANVKIQNNVSVYEGVDLEDDVFCGPSMVFTNVNTPRSGVNRRGQYQKTVVKKGVTLGANSTIVCGEGLTIGEYAFVGAGAVVINDVPAHALVVGNPARVAGWRCHCGLKIKIARTGKGACEGCGARYVKGKGGVLPARAK